MDLVGLLEVLIIGGTLYAIYYHSTHQRVEEPESDEEFIQLMLQRIDQSNLNKAQTTPAGLLTKEYCLQLHRVVAEQTHRAGMDQMHRFRVARRQLFEHRKWKQYKDLIKEHQQIQHRRFNQYCLRLCLHIQVAQDVFQQSTQMLPHREFLRAQEDGVLEAAVKAKSYRKVALRRARLAQVEYLSRLEDFQKEC